MDNLLPAHTQVLPNAHRQRPDPHVGRALTDGLLQQPKPGTRIHGVSNERTAKRAALGTRTPRAAGEMVHLLRGGGSRDRESES